MSLNYPRPHHGHASEYQVSGIPWSINIRNIAALDVDISGDGANDAKLAGTVNFPYVTRWVTVSSEAPCWISFSATGEASERVFFIPPLTTTRLELKCKTMLVYAAANPQNIYVLAGLTNVLASDFPDITGLPGIGA